jgi:hypothetical protein
MADALVCSCDFAGRAQRCRPLLVRERALALHLLVRRSRLRNRARSCVFVRRRRRQRASEVICRPTFCWPRSRRLSIKITRQRIRFEHLCWFDGSNVCARARRRRRADPPSFARSLWAPAGSAAARPKGLGQRRIGLALELVAPAQDQGARRPAVRWRQPRPAAALDCCYFGALVRRSCSPAARSEAL